MFRQIKSFVLVAIAVGVVMGGSTPALGRPRRIEQGECYKNGTGSEAKCLLKYLYKWDISGDPESDKLGVCTKKTVGDYTEIKCSAGTGVPNGERVTVSYSGKARDGDAEIYKAELYTDSACSAGKFVGYAASVRPKEESSRARPVTVRVVLSNDTKGEAAVQGSEIYWADPHKLFHHRDLNEKLWTCVDEDNNTMAPATQCLDDGDCPSSYYCGYYDEGEDQGITWKQAEEQDPEDDECQGWPQTFVLLLEDDDTYPDYCLGELKPTDRVLFRFYTDLVGNYGTSPYEVTQYRVSELIPAVSEWGLVVIALLILAAGTVVIRRRRAMAAQA